MDRLLPFAGMRLPAMECVALPRTNAPEIGATLANRHFFALNGKRSWNVHAHPWRCGPGGGMQNLEHM